MRQPLTRDVQLELTALELLDGLCRSRRLTLRLELVDDVTLWRAGRDPVHPECALRLRVQEGDDILAGRLEGCHGANISELAIGCLEILRRKGVH